MLNIRRGTDGSFWIPRKDKETEDYLDSLYIRVPNQLKWINKISNVVSIFANEHQGATVYIVGKGPSLDFIKAKFFEDSESPIICINESIHQIEKLNLINDIYVTQLDQNLGETCRPINAKMFISPQCANLYDTDVLKYVVNPQTFGLLDGCISAQYAIMLARHMGCINVEMFCFDGCTENNYNYAQCIGYDSGKGGSKIRFAEHKVLIDQTAKNIPLAWLTPKADGTLLRREGL